MQLLSAYVQLKKTAHDLIKNNPYNLMVILRTSCATVQNWLLPTRSEFPNPRVLDFIHKLEENMDVLLELETFFENKKSG